MEKFVAEFDPLKALDAEYAAVVAQTRSTEKAPSNGVPHGENQREDGEPELAQSDSDEESDGESMDMYALLPTSPVGSGEGFDDEDDGEDSELNGTAADAGEAREEAVAPPPPMDASTKNTIMATMQTLKLQPPPWAQDADIPDDELIELVQRRLRFGVPKQNQ